MVASCVLLCSLPPSKQGDDVYGRYMRAVLQAEGIAQVEPVATQALSPELDQTLLCFVLLAPGGKHSFCSRYDFGPWPLLPFVAELPAGVTRVLEGTEALFINGFCFDELSPAAVLAAARTAADAGAAVFFDPGGRAQVPCGWQAVAAGSRSRGWACVQLLTSACGPALRVRRPALLDVCRGRAEGSAGGCARRR